MLRRTFLRQTVHSILTEGSVPARFRPASTTARSRSPKAATVEVIPMLHVASRNFYDGVLSRISDVIKEAEAKDSMAFVVTEGIAVKSSDRQTEIDEVTQIGSSPELAKQVESLALAGTIYNSDTLASICAENDLPADLVMSSPASAAGIRLQDAYFKPLLMARHASHIALGDIVLEEERSPEFQDEIKKAVTGSGDPSAAVPLYEALHAGVAKGLREANCTTVVQACLAAEIAGPAPTVVVVWGHHHSAGIRKLLLRPTQTDAVGFEPTGEDLATRDYGLTPELKQHLVQWVSRHEGLGDQQ